MSLDPHLLLEKVHPHLALVARKAWAVAPTFVIVQGLRSTAAEKIACETGHSHTMHSRHLPNAQGLSCAIDVAAIVNGLLSFAPHHEEETFTPISTHMKAAANELSIPLEWGGDWHSFKDWGHFQLPWKSYP